MNRARRALGLDVGERRIGVAIADELGVIASPLAVVTRGSRVLDQILGMARSADADRLVIGLPTGLSGREGPQAAAVRAFADSLAELLAEDMRIEFWDERLTTAVAERSLREHGRRRSRRKGEVDAVAAAVILQGYLDANRTRAHSRPSSRGNEAG